MKYFNIGNKVVGENQPCFFIAEAGVNHNGSIELGKKLIDAAVDAKADAVKFQTFQTEKIITRSAPKSSYHVETTGGDDKQSWYELLKSQEMSKAMHEDLIQHCNRNNIIFLSTPYDEESVDLLFNLEIPAFKTASTDTNNIPLLKYIAKKGRPMILSTAMSTMQEVEDAVSEVKKEGLRELGVLQCTGNYPAHLKESNLLVMHEYQEKLNCVIGYSDHISDIINPIAATAMGAKIYEKHFTLDKTLPGPDHRMSLNPIELSKTIEAIRATEIAMGNKKKIVLESEKENRIKLRKSITTTKAISKGELIESNMIAIKRPGNGMSPSMLGRVIGKKASVDIPSGNIVTEEMLND